MKEKDSIVGTRIGIYDVMYECDFRANDGHRLYHVKCSECGWETDMIKSQIDKASSCTHIGLGGKYKNQTTKWKNKRIGKIFSGMKARCYDKSDKAYRWYGEKGITICDEWLNNPELFEEWALQSGYGDNLTIDRKEEDKSYCPENCRWITLEDNAKYKSTTSLIEIDGEVHTGKDWARKLGLGVNRINIYIRDYGLENTREFIRRYMNSPNKISSCNKNYYSLYMSDNNISC